MRSRIALFFLGAVCTSLPWSIRVIPEPRVLPQPPIRPQGSDVAEWYGYLSEQRKVNLALLEDDIEAGQFPQNQEFPFEATPVFRDSGGTSCAVAHLMQKAGREQEVEQIARENNLVRVMSVKGGPLLEWMATSGFTLEECALIQPTYDYKAKAKAQQKRVRGYLQEVLKTLRQDAHRSLEIACRRLLPSFPRSEASSVRGFFVDRPGPLERTVDLRGVRPIQARVSFMNSDGNLVKAGPWVPLRPESPCFGVTAEAKIHWWLLEWRSQPGTPEGSVVIKAATPPG